MTEHTPRNPEPPTSSIDVAHSSLTQATSRKMAWRLLPLLVLGYFIAYLDRANISFASQGLSDEFGMSATAFGFAAGVFFIGYVICEVPSNLILYRVGARRWLSRIMVTWGLCSIAVIFVSGPTGVYLIRFLLGAAEAGFFPGIIFYLSLWFPNAQRARMTSIFMLAIPVALAFGGLLNGWLLDTLDGALGLEGWRWLFVVGGIPAVVLGAAYFALLPDNPSKARWLDARERVELTSVLAAEAEQRAQHAPHSAWGAFRDRRVLTLALVYFLIQFGGYPLVYWLPTIVSEAATNLSATRVGFLVAIPYSLLAVTVFLMARWFGRRDRQVGHIAGPLLVSVAAFIGVAATHGSPMLTFLIMCVAVAAGLAATPMFWSLPTHYLTGVAAAGGIALINSLGNTAGFLSPYAFGWIKDAVPGETLPLLIVLVVSNLLAVAVLLALRFGRSSATEFGVGSGMSSTESGARS